MSEFLEEQWAVFNSEFYYLFVYLHALIYFLFIFSGHRIFLINVYLYLFMYFLSLWGIVGKGKVIVREKDHIIFSKSKEIFMCFKSICISKFAPIFNETAT